MHANPGASKCGERYGNVPGSIGRLQFMTYEDDEFIHIPTSHFRGQVISARKLGVIVRLDAPSSNEKVSNTPNGLYLKRLFD
jgi:hypothetical protein